MNFTKFFNNSLPFFILVTLGPVVYGDAKDSKSKSNDNGKNGTSTTSTTELSTTSTSTTTTTTEISLPPIESKEDEFRTKRNFQQRILHEPSYHDHGHEHDEYGPPRHRDVGSRPRNHHHQFHPEDSDIEQEPGMHPGPPPPGFGGFGDGPAPGPRHGPPGHGGHGHGRRTPALEGKDQENIRAAQATMQFYYDDLIQLQSLMSNMLTTSDDEPQYSSHSQFHDDYDY